MLAAGHMPVKYIKGEKKLKYERKYNKKAHTRNLGGPQAIGKSSV
jgi:hypothetical protein